MPVCCGHGRLGRPRGAVTLRVSGCRYPWASRDDAWAASERRGRVRRSVNDAVTMFLPNGLGTRSPEWRTVHQGPHVTVQVATPETLLAMKLYAARRRGNRDVGDLAAPLPLCGITSLEPAEQLDGDFCPGDECTESTEQLVRRLIDDDLRANLNRSSHHSAGYGNRPGVQRVSARYTQIALYSRVGAGDSRRDTRADTRALPTVR